MNSEDNKIVEDLRDVALRLIPKLIADKDKAKRLVQLDIFRKEASDAWVQFASAAVASGQFALDDNLEGSSDCTFDAVVNCAEIADILLSEWKSRFRGDEDFDEDSERSDQSSFPGKAGIVDPGSAGTPPGGTSVDGESGKG